MLVNNDDLIRELDELGAKVTGRTDTACNKMADVIRPALIAAAPYDAKNTAYRHLKEVIAKTKPKRQKDSAQVVIWLKQRGIPKAKKGGKAVKNWNADKQIYKLVVAEYGRSNLPAKPFWIPTVSANAQKALQAGVQELKEGMK